MELKIDVNGGRAMVFSPYNRQFVKKLKGIGDARWNPNKECWVVPEEDVSRVRQMMVEAYGENDFLEGTVFKVRGITQAALEMEKDNRKIAVEKIAEAEIDKAALIEELARLEERVKEIKDLLKTAD